MSADSSAPTPKPAAPTTPTKPPGKRFIVLMALMTSLVALSVDGMLPVLGDIARELEVTAVNDRQLVISSLFLGMVFGQCIYGPVSDAVGRKGPVLWGCALFMVGSLIAASAETFSFLLIGRAVQGIGAAGPRIVIVAMIRDQYQGAQMARVMSLIMTVFILVPALAPALGQGIAIWAGWRAIFYAFFALALAGSAWFWWQQAETLAPERRITLSWKHLASAAMEVFRHPVSRGYTITAGFVFASFIGFLNSSQQVFVEQYELGTKFPLYFAVLALALGASTLTNAKLVMRFSMARLCRTSLLVVLTLSSGFFVFAAVYAGSPPFLGLMLYLLVLFYSVGILFGNMNALALEPMGHIAGLASAMIASFTTFMSMMLGGAIGAAYDGTVLPMIGGFAVLSLAGLITMTWTERLRRKM